MLIYIPAALLREYILKQFQLKMRRGIVINKEKTLKKVECLAIEYDQEYYGCAQCVLAALKAVLKDKILIDVFKAASGLAGAVGRIGNTCGAVTGGVMILSSFLGWEYKDFFGPENMESLRIAKKVVGRFIQEYGSATCFDIQTKIMGRYFDFWKKEDEKAFLDSGGHDNKCLTVCGKGARWVLEILFEEGLVVDKDI